MSSIISDISVLLNAFGIGLGLFWGSILFSKTRRSSGQYFLASLLILFAIIMGNTIVQLSGYGDIIPAYQPVVNVLIFLIGPLLLGYTFSQIRVSQKWKETLYFHFIPILLLLIIVLAQTLIYNSREFTFLIICSWNFQVFFYLILIYRELNHHNSWHSFPATIFKLFLPIWIVNLVLFLLKILFFPIPDVVFLNVTVLFFLPIIFVAFRSLKGMDLEKNKKKVFELSKDRYKDYALRLQDLMENNQLYKNPNLKIQELANLAGISPRYVSATLNHQLDQSFYEYVNNYRIKDVVEKLRSQESEAFSLEGIAQESGFNSMSAFYKAFRKDFGMTPGEFRKGLNIKNK